MRAKFKRMRRRVRKIVAVPVIIALCAGAVADTAVSGNQKIDYVIVDGYETTRVSSYSRDPMDVLDDNGFDLSGATVEVKSGEIYTEITLNRTVQAFLDLYGETSAVTVPDTYTVADTLSYMYVELSDSDTVSCPLTAVVYDGMEITVTRTTFEYETVTDVITAEPQYIDSPYMIAGREVTMVDGEEGLCEYTYMSTYINGLLVSTELVSTDVLKEPVAEIISKGSRTGSSHSYSSTTECLREPDDGTVTTLNGETLHYSSRIEMTATAYTYNAVSNSTNTTSSGVPAQVGVVAALPSTLPEGTLVYIAATDGSWEYGLAVVGDRPAHNIIDLFMEDRDECLQFGVRSCDVYILG